MQAPLNERLKAYADALRELNFPFSEAYDDLVARLKAGEVGAMAPAVGEPMPPFSLPAHTGRLVSLEEVLRAGPAVISFNRGHWCPSARSSSLPSRATTRTLRPTVPSSSRSFPTGSSSCAATQTISNNNFIRLSDMDNAYALSLGLVHVARARGSPSSCRGAAIGLSDYQGNDGWFVPAARPPSCVGADGRVLARHVDPEFRRRMEIAEHLAALDTLADHRRECPMERCRKDARQPVH